MVLSIRVNRGTSRNPTPEGRPVIASARPSTSLGTTCGEGGILSALAALPGGCAPRRPSDGYWRPCSSPCVAWSRWAAGSNPSRGSSLCVAWRRRADLVRIPPDVAALCTTQHVLGPPLAERAGFEPAEEFPLRPLSKRVPSATRSPLRLSKSGAEGGLRGTGSSRAFARWVAGFGVL